jgi:hypothetical protein
VAARRISRIDGLKGTAARVCSGILTSSRFGADGKSEQALVDVGATLAVKSFRGRICGCR